jgi:cobalt-zinc-cadmium efflux system membrane fusion protein
VAEYRRALASLETTRGQAEVARLALERADRLVEIGGIAQAEHQRRKAEHAAALAAVKSSEAQLANLRQALSRFGVNEGALKDGDLDANTGARSTLRAPFAGTVLDVQAVSGETVSPERELATVADLSTVWILGDVYERDLATISEGREARVVTDAYPDEPLSCRVTYVSDVLDAQSRTAKVRCEAKNPNGRLRLQMFARMEIAAGASRDVLAIPRSAIQQIDGETSVFIRTGDESFERRAVRLGTMTEEWAEVTSGVTAGDRVVTTGAVMLKSRLKVSEFAESEENERK